MVCTSRAHAWSMGCLPWDPGAASPMVAFPVVKLVTGVTGASSLDRPRWIMQMSWHPRWLRRPSGAEGWREWWDLVEPFLTKILERFGTPRSSGLLVRGSLFGRSQYFEWCLLSCWRPSCCNLHRREGEERADPETCYFFLRPNTSTFSFDSIARMKEDTSIFGVYT